MFSNLNNRLDFFICCEKSFYGSRIDNYLKYGIVYSYYYEKKCY